MLKLSDNQLVKIAQSMAKKDEPKVEKEETKDSVHTALTYIAKLYNHLTEEMPTFSGKMTSEKLAAFDDLQAHLKAFLEDFGEE